ncbi:MAG: GNAT family N-acetyltransferase [Cypionkella sp.]
MEFVSGLDQVGPAEWDACVPDGNPFMRHAFLQALETGGTAVADKGYVARHLLLRDEAGILVAAAPLYLKSHSEAEIGSDFGWGLAHARAVGPYYPKLQVECPACPIPGPRLLMRPGSDNSAMKATLISALKDEARTAGVSSVHVNFTTLDDCIDLRQQGFLCDAGLRFVWSNRGYSTFEQFLGDLKGDRRGMIRRERREVQSSQLTFDQVEGADITAAFINDFLPLYLSTYEKYATSAQMSPATFHALRESMADRMVFQVARLDGELVAATMFMHGGDGLTAMHWGSRIDMRFLHFELTYYRGIEYAIERGLATLDVGPTGDHKAPRGFPAMPSLFAHWFVDEGFAKMLVPGIARRMQTVRAKKADLDMLSGFRRDLGHEAWPEALDVS